MILTDLTDYHSNSILSIINNITIIFHDYILFMKIQINYIKFLHNIFNIT